MAKEKKSAKDGKQDEMKLPLSRKQVEGMLAKTFGAPPHRSSVQEAQHIMYDAWESPDPLRRIALAKKALEVSADCADAYVLLAQESTKRLDKAIKLYRQGVEAGERALGKKAFVDDVGDFWGLLETRPYMRARHGLAQCLWEDGQHEEAIGHFRDLLRLNPGDNQGIRYLLMPCLLEMGRDGAAEELYEAFKDDGMAMWLYSRVLLDFRKHGDSSVSKKSLKIALKENPHVPAFLLNKKEMPKYLPECYGFGDENEAIIYVHGSMPIWKITPGALDWLRKNTG